MHPLPLREFDDMFDAVVRGEADCAVVPIENTLAGSVIKNYDLLANTDLTIIGEVVLRIAHNLIVPRGVKLTDIRRVYSHPVALAQCEDFLRKLRAQVPSLDVLPAYDTSGSVKMVVNSGRRDEAAIASESAAAVWKGQILASGIESNPHNFTRFFVMARPDRAANIRATSKKKKERKTSLVFRIANRPGSLYSSLYAFAAEKVDLTKIESRPIVGRPWGVRVLPGFHGRSAGRQRPPRLGCLGRRRRERAHFRLLRQSRGLSRTAQRLPAASTDRQGSRGLGSGSL